MGGFSVDRGLRPGIMSSEARVMAPYTSEVIATEDGKVVIENVPCHAGDRLHVEISPARPAVQKTAGDVLEDLRGTWKVSEDPLEYQRRIREEWER